MSHEINYQEMTVAELETIAGGTGIDQLLVKDFDATFQQNIAADRRVNSVGPNGATAVEETALKQTRTDLDNDLFAANLS